MIASAPPGWAGWAAAPSGLNYDGDVEDTLDALADHLGQPHRPRPAAALGPVIE